MLPAVRVLVLGAGLSGPDPTTSWSEPPGETVRPSTTRCHRDLADHK